MSTAASRRIRVVLVVDDLGFGGAERQVVELANSMDRHRFDVHVCTLSDHIPLGKELRDSEHNLHVVEKKTRFDFTVVPRLAYLLRTLQADIVHGYLFSAEIASRIAGRIARTKLVLGSERNANRIVFRKINILAYKLTNSCVDAIIANSNTGAESNRKIFSRSRSDYRVVHNGVDVERFQPVNGTVMRRKLKIPEHHPVIGVFANFKKQKNHAMLFRSFKLLLDSCPEARLMLVGSQPVDSRGRLNAYQGQLDRLVDDLGIRRQCNFLGHREETEHLYPVCDIAVLPSLHEGTPNVLLEAMACGIPVIATNICDNGYIVRDGQVGCLVDVGDEVGMARCMKSLLDDCILRLEMGQKARQWVLREFSNKQMAKKMETIYLELLKNSPRRTGS